MNRTQFTLYPDWLLTVCSSTTPKDAALLFIDRWDFSDHKRLCTRRNTVAIGQTKLRGFAGFSLTTVCLCQMIKIIPQTFVSLLFFPKK